MATDIREFNDHRMEAIMGRLLQIGVLLASAVVLCGGVVYVRAHSGSPVDYRVFSPGSGWHLGRLFRLIANGDGAAIVQLGVLLLIATPVARVVFAVIGFALERDRLYVAVSLMVLAVLMVGLLHSS